MTSSEIRQSFLDFFKSKGHTIVPSSSLLPDSPNLLFTNAGMNQFVPIFLGQRAPDVSKWPGAIPGSDTRAADTQKCIRAGGKHNDLEDVGLDTYHLTFFEMLGNWSFGDYFKRESLTWGWELLTKVWGIPAKRLFATVYAPDKSKGDPADFDQEASDIWTEIFLKEGLDPKVHIVHGNKKDNFWMMGETGPCGPCSEIHFNLLPSDDEQPARALVNVGSQRCIEIWNHVFIQFNANPDGTYSPLPAKHVDTGMGFDRMAGFHAGTKGFKEFSDLPSAYSTDIFTALFAELEKLSGKRYSSTLPERGLDFLPEPVKTDITFRVIGDHIRTLTFAIADGIEPGNNDRNYVLRRILRRAVSYSRNIDMREPFLYRLVGILADTMGDVFPTIRERRSHVEAVIRREEEAFNLTLDKGLELFNYISGGNNLVLGVFTSYFPNDRNRGQNVPEISASRRASKYFDERALGLLSHLVPLSEGDREVLRTQPERLEQALVNVRENPKLKEKAIAYLRVFPSEKAFDLYHTYGFPVDLTEVRAKERHLTVDSAEVERLMQIERERSRAAQRKEVISLSTTDAATEFVGYDSLEADALVVNTHETSGKSFAIVDRSPLFAEMGGQVGDTGMLYAEGRTFRVLNTAKKGQAFYLQLDEPLRLSEQDSRPQVQARITVDADRRNAIQRHHTVTHLFHWALHEVVSKDSTQKGSYVGPEKLTFDFNSAPLSPDQIAKIEERVNERILENTLVQWFEVPYAEIKGNPKIMQAFGEKYGDRVRVVQIGDSEKLKGYSMELCGGTHTRATGEIGLFRIVAESAIAAGVRRIEAVSGLEAYKQANDQLHLIKTVAGKLNTPVAELEKKIESLLAQQKELEKQLRSANQKQAAETARTLVSKAQTIGSAHAIVENLGPADGDFLQSIADALKGQFKGVVVLGGASNGSVSLVATVSPELTKQIQAGKIIQTIAPIVGGKGGGKPDNARGGGKDVGKLDEALAKARSLL
jgi:alanyl-tRNA synthetase